MARFGVARLLVTALATGVLAQCGASSPTSPTAPAPPAQNLGAFVSSVTSGGVSAASRSGSPPQAGAGPRVTPVANANVVAGGSNQVTLTSPTPIAVVYVFVTNVSGGATGYYELTVARPTTQVFVVVNLAVNLTTTSFDLTYAVGGATGPIGPYSPMPTRVLPAGTGDVQISASWDSFSDVDLHVIDPRGEEIYYSNPRSASGGELDLDSNAACDIDRKNNENVRWPAGRAPAGTYTVLVNYWSSCGVPQTQWVVRVNAGATVNTYTGTFGPGQNNSRRLVTTFQYSGSGRLTIAPAAAIDRSQPRQHHRPKGTP